MNGVISRDDENQRKTYHSPPTFWMFLIGAMKCAKHVASESFLLSKLAMKLLGYLGIGYKWIVAFSWLMLYATCLMPGFLQAAWYYFFSSRVLRNISYGHAARNTLDIYMPKKAARRPKPVVIFVTGGAWIIGYKAWGTLLGWALSDHGVIVVSIDYRNFPQGTVGNMVDDVTAGVSWTLNHILNYGGDPNRVTLVSQSAGAHISTLALLRAAEKKTVSSKDSPPSWSPLCLHAFVGISGPYEIEGIVEHLHSRGLYRSILHKVMEGEGSLQRNSPTCLVHNANFQEISNFLPPFHLFHGTEDISIPFSSSVEFARRLKKAGAEVKLKIYAEKTHTDLVIQDLMRGGKDELLDDILDIIHSEGKYDQEVPPRLFRGRMIPEFLIQVARLASPF